MNGLTFEGHVALQRMAHWSRAYAAAYPLYWPDKHPQTNAAKAADRALEQFDEKFPPANRREPGRYD